MKADLKAYAQNIREIVGEDFIGTDYERLFVGFMNDNEWFGAEPEFKDDVLLIDTEAMKPYTDRILDFFRNYGLGIEDKVELLSQKYGDQMPDSAGLVSSFFDEMEIPSDNRYYLYDFLCYRQVEEFSSMDDEGIAKLVDYAVYDLTKANGDILCMLISWLKQYYRMHWFKDYSMTKRRTSENAAYDIDEYLELLYYLFNETYIEEEEMYRKAAESKNYGRYVAVYVYAFHACHKEHGPYADRTPGTYHAARRCPEKYCRRRFPTGRREAYGIFDHMEACRSPLDS